MRQLAAVLSLAGFLLVAGCAAPGAQPGAQAAQARPKYQLVIQVSENDPKLWHLALSNALLFKRNTGEGNSQIEIVAIGPGLNMLKAESSVTARIGQALDQSIDVVACGETMHAMKLGKDDLIGGVRVVPGGLIEIADRQRAGWIYYRP